MFAKTGIKKFPRFFTGMHEYQGKLLSRGIVKKTVNLCSIFSNTFFVKKTYVVKLQSFLVYIFFQKIFYEWKPYKANIVCKKLK